MAHQPVWSDKYRFGIPTIDQQHEELFRLFCELLQTIAEEPEQQDITNCFTKLYQHVVHHFEYEEYLMQKSAFPGLLPHQQIHKDIHNDLEALLSIYQETFESEVKLEIPRKVATFLEEWLEEHIDYHDRQYALHLLSKGITD